MCIRDRNKDVFRKFREWGILKISDENYLFNSKKYTLGYLAEAVISLSLIHI